MKAQRSPLLWKNFSLLRSFFQLTDPPKDGPQVIETTELFNRYPIDVDFKVNRMTNGEWQVFAKVLVNWTEPSQAGYRVLVEGSGLFAIEGEQTLPPDKLHNLAYYSTVNLMLNRLRAHIASITAPSVLGSYELPALDITDLFKQKAAALAKSKTKKPAGKK